MKRRKKVAIFGGGVAGLSAAHELIERGYEVALYDGTERYLPTRLFDDGLLGGKARTQWHLPQTIPGLPADARLPGEHGFRFFPRFYKHVIDTMSRIPVGANRWVSDRLRPSTEAGFARSGQTVVFPKRMPSDPRELLGTMRSFFREQGARFSDIALFNLKITQFLTSCAERRSTEYESQTFWRFIEGHRYSERFQRYLNATPRTLVAMSAHQSNACTLGTILIQLMLDQFTPGETSDRVLDGPTSVRWLNPWVAYLRRRGVQIHLEHTLVQINTDGPRIRSVVVFDDTQASQGQAISREITADYFLLAVSLKQSLGVLEPVTVIDPMIQRMADTQSLPVMDIISGIQFYLPRYTPFVHGHLYFPESDYALTSVSQAQFWGGAEKFRTRYGYGQVGDILSVDVAEWSTDRQTLGLEKSGNRPEPDKLAREVWRQLQEAVNGPQGQPLDAFLDYHIDDDLKFDPGEDGGAGKYDQFSYAHLVHPPGFWRLRPEPHGVVENLFLAGDYVRCATDLATMEAANETARRAVNALLDVDGSSESRCTLFPLIEPKLFDAPKAMDRERYLRGEPHLADALELSRGISTGVYNSSDAEATDRQVILQLGGSPSGAAWLPRIPRLILR